MIDRVRLANHKKRASDPTSVRQIAPSKPLHVHIHCKGEADDWATIRKAYSKKGVIVHVHIYDIDSVELKRLLGTYEATMDEMEQALEAQYKSLTRKAAR